MTNLSKDMVFITSILANRINSLKGKNIFITGGTGFFGKSLLEFFVYLNSTIEDQHQKISILVLSRNPEVFKNNYPHLCTNIEFAKGDVCTFDFPTVDFDYFIHAATPASATFNKEYPMEMLTSIIDGTKRVLDLAEISNTKKILFISSGAVYGKQPYNVSNILDDSLIAPDMSEPTSAYGEGKRVSELMGNIFSKRTGVEFVSARCFTFAGPYLPLDGTFAFGNFVKNVLNEEDILIKGDGSPLRSYLYNGDLIIWLLSILVDGESGQSYNVGSDEFISIKDLAILISKRNPSLKVNILKKEVPINIERYVPSIKKAQNLLGLKVYTKLDDIISRTFND